MSVQWRVIEGFSSYEVSNTGLVRKIENSRLLKSRILSQDSVVVNLRIDGKVYTKTVARLVAQAFVTGGGSGYIVKHKNNNLSNNHANNLYWSTFSQDMTHLRKTGKHSGGSRRVVINETGQEFDTIKECAAYLGAHPASVSSVLSGRRKTTKGYTLSYVHDRFDVEQYL